MVEQSYQVERVCIRGNLMSLRVDGRNYEIDITKQSQRLAAASQKEREHYLLSPSGYGIDWPELDEDLSIDALIGIKHEKPKPLPISA